MRYPGVVPIVAALVVLPLSGSGAAVQPPWNLPEMIASGAMHPGGHFDLEGVPAPPTNASPAWIGESNQAGAEYGQTAASAGDVNGDGYGDVIVGAPLYDASWQDGGRAYLYLGSPNGLSTTPSWVVNGDQAFCKFGWTVAGAGDVNRDGYDDILVSAPFHGGTHAAGEGRVYLYLGGPSGPSTVPSWVAEGGQYAAELGCGLAGAGDVNGDGYADVIMGAHLYDGPGGVDEGRALVYLGGPAGLSSTPVWTAGSGLAGSLFGWSVSSAGDVNHDGYDDVVVGAVLYGDSEGGPQSGGRAFLYLGSPSGPGTSPAWQTGPGQQGAYYGFCVAAAGDINADGYDDEVFVFQGGSEGLPLSASAVLRTSNNGAWFGYSVAGAGDVNEDGYDDVIVGVPLDHHAYSHEGSALIFLGSAGGLDLEPPWISYGGQAECYFGSAVAIVRSVNGDVLVTAMGYDDPESDEGRACLYLGPDCGMPSSAPVASAGEAALLELENPFSPGGPIACRIDRARSAVLGLWDSSGRLVFRTKLSGEGAHTVRWTAVDQCGRPVPSGVYFAGLDTARSRIVRKFVLIATR
jgi:hypothetical protein